jgi:hypothetical protein
MSEDLIEQLAVAAAGMDCDSVLESLMASKHAAMLVDPQAVAAYIVSLSTANGTAV